MNVRNLNIRIIAIFYKVYLNYYPELRLNSFVQSKTDYLDGFQYLTTGSDVLCVGCPAPSSELQFVPTSEGYFDFVENKYIYNYADHLGNVRVSYFKNGSGIEVLGENNYYPFGLRHEGYNDFDGNPSYQYKYNGKELQTETGMYDYGARFYMPDIGRWGVQDPLAEKYTAWSPYNYVFNNPINWIDPDGMDPDPPKGNLRFIINLGGAADAADAAKTRYNEIKESYPNDKIVMLNLDDLGKLEGLVESNVKKAQKEGYGKTVEASFYGHGGTDGPVGTEPTSKNSLTDETGENLDKHQLSSEGWKNINWNFDSKKSIAGFYGCNTSDFATLSFVPTAEGYYNFENNKYIYNYVDHLGNTRLSYFNNGSGIEALEESNYYPFGLKHAGYNALAGNSAYQYKYQGQELQNETGWYSFKWRNYMPDVGRFFNVDPLAEDYSYQSPYNFAENQVIAFVELEGLEKGLPWYLNKSKSGGKPVLTLGAHNIKLPYYNRNEYGGSVAGDVGTFATNTLGSIYNGVASSWNEAMEGKTLG